MFTPSDMERMPKQLEQLYADLELRIMQDIIRRIKINGEITRAADWQIYRLHELGESKKVIKKMIRESLKLSDKELRSIYDDAIASGYAREEKLYEAAGVELIPFKENMVLQQTIKAVREQTQEQFKNITQSLGFAEKINGKIQFTELADFYQKTLDAAMLDISSGAFDYNTVINRTAATLANSGLRSVDYATGWSNRIEVAVRRAVMTGVTQVTGKINEQNAEDLDTDYFEISWHADARPTHRKWQGRVYSKAELETVCGLGTGDGLAGWNCRHTYYPFIPGISERTYTDEQLDEMNAKENTPKKFQGKEYTSYEASQKQRRMETTMRAQRQKIKLLQEGGADENDIISARCRYRKTMSDYVEFSEAMGIPQQRARIYGDGLGNVGVISGIRKNTSARSLVGDYVQYNKHADFTVDIPYYSDKLNESLSEAARKVAKVGSDHKYEYSSLIDVSTGSEVDFGTSKEYNSVNHYYKFLREHLDGKYVMVHNHNTHTQISLPDMQELVMWDNLDGVISVSNDGYICCAISNGKKTNKYLFSKYKQGDYGVEKLESEIEQEVLMVDLAAKEFTRGGILKHGQK